ncbi:DUF1062 domain-containing protein [Erwinia amylovora]|uniref:DUF1062 domain-containing protein n=1 Tax=Erwinia amylovora TaxID=552 RepID=UPI001443A9CE|nr:DUF1062 domain-containing protein [Erwinia amylovora]
MMKNENLIWLVKPLGYQSITKRCPACEIKKLFYPSGCFRVNAQKKTLDVWNIYKCEKCDYTWNIDIYTRISNTKLPPEVLEYFLQNNIEQVRRYSYDYSVLKKNSAKTGPTPEFIIEGADPCELDSTAVVQIQILFEFAIPVRLIHILSRKLLLSHNDVMRLIEQQVILDIPPSGLNKKLKQPLAFRFDLQRFHQLAPSKTPPAAQPLVN